MWLSSQFINYNVCYIAFKQLSRPVVGPAGSDSPPESTLRGAEEQPTPPPPIAPGKQGEMEKIKLTEIQDGVKKWILTADNADYLKDKDKIYINNVWVEVFGKELEKETDDIIITGDKGFIGVKSGT